MKDVLDEDGEEVRRGDGRRDARVTAMKAVLDEDGEAVDGAVNVEGAMAAMKAVLDEDGDEGEPVSGSGGGGELGALDRGGESLAPRPVGRVPRGA